MINTPFTLSSGLQLPNRLVKAAMTERPAKANGLPNEKHYKLYRTWAKGSSALLITGNMIVDPKHIESAGNIVLKNENCLPSLTKLARVAKTGGQYCMVQLNHAGRQTNLFNNLHPLSASAVKLEKQGLFGKPRPMTEIQISEVIEAFTRSAVWVKKAGFDGVQIHAAHGYLLNQFLSPLTNRRTDKWGGSLKNRARLLLDIIRAVRSECGGEFTISVKLNSADFQRGGFEESDSLQVIGWLEKEKIDLLEISGGTYEKLAFFDGQPSAGQSTVEREAYFMDFARKLRKGCGIPLMVTGGFRTYAFASECLQKQELDFVGMARPYLLHENFASRFMGGTLKHADDVQIKTGLKAMDDMAAAGFWNLQIGRLAAGKHPGKSFGAWRSAAELLAFETKGALARKFK